MTELHRWDIGLVAALVGIGSGVLLANLVLVAGAVIGLVFALFGSVSTVPDSASLSANRQFRAAGAGPGSEVTVALAIRNTGSAVLPDCRVADGVPDGLPVIGGSPRGSKPLAPGETLTIEYTVVLERGRFEFDEPACRLRSFAGTDERTQLLSVEGDQTLTCGGALADPPLADSTLQHAGTVSTDSGGSGLEFYSTRQYHHGDPMNRINWHQVAKTGEFVTVQYRRERTAQTVIVMDCRPQTRVRHKRGYPTGGALGVYAAERIHDSLSDAGVVTTLTAVGLDTDVEALVGPDGLPWVGTDSAKGAATALFRSATRTASDTLAGPSVGPKSAPVSGEQMAAAAARADGGLGEETTEQFLSRLPEGAQVIVCSPLLDDWPVEFATTLSAHDHSCLVVSPDVTLGAMAGQRISAIHRRRRITALERTDVDVTDWPADYPVEYALSETVAQL